MDKVVQQTASSAEESASASEELTAQADQMKGYVDDLALLIGGSANESAGGRDIIGGIGTAVAGRIAAITRRKDPSPDSEEG
ncbi:MAG: hypothetical protein IH628_17380 [Proteobacteria bacterium]|nr:hypothetical protein [Pseudomonadota bacterium]